MSVDILRETQLLHSKVHALFMRHPLRSVLLYSVDELKNDPKYFLRLSARHQYELAFDHTRTQYLLERYSRVYDLRKRRMVLVPTIIEVNYVSDEQIHEVVDRPAVLETDEYDWHMNVLAMMRESLVAFTVDVTKEYLRQNLASERESNEKLRLN